MGTNLDLTNAIPGMTVTTQYQDRGIIFSPGRRITADATLPPYGGNVVSVPAGLLHHTQDSDGLGIGGISESPVRTIHANFSRPLQKLTLFVSRKTSVEIYDGAEQSIGKDEASEGDDRWRQVVLTSSTGQISSFTSTSFLVGHAVGRIVMYEVMPPEPDFTLYYTGGLVKLKVGIPTQIRIKVFRSNGSVGGIALTGGTPDPSTVEVIGIDPNPYDGEREETIAVSIVAKRNDIQPGVSRPPITISAIANAKNGLAGRQIRNVDIKWTILEAVNVKIVGMEITQGIQNYQVPEADVGDGNIRRTQQYWGVGLAANRKTLVRVFCSIPFKPLYPIEDYLIKLHGWQVQHHDSEVFRGSPQQQFSFGGRAIQTTTYPLVERWRYVAAFDFILPPEWTRYTAGVTLRAEINPFHPFFTYETDLLNNTFTVTDIAFIEKANLSIQPYQLRIFDANGNDLNGPIKPLSSIFGDMTIMHPIGDNQLDVLPWAGWIDITAIFNKGEDWNRTCTKVMAKFRKALKKDKRPVNKYIPVGVFPAWTNSTGPRIRLRGDTNDPDDISVVIVQDEFRPWTGVAHEIGHYLGRKHASAANKAKGAEDWPPDQQGLIQGVGWDFALSTYKFTEEPTPGNYVHPWFDYMSYHDDGNSWVSVRGWNYLNSRFSKFWKPQSLVAEGSTTADTTFRLRNAITVSAVRFSDGDWEITDVDLVTDEAPLIGSDELAKRYQILVLDSAGQVLHQAIPRVRIDSDQDPDARLESMNMSATFEIKDPTVIASVQVTEDNNVVAKRNRPPNPPIVEDLKVSLDKNTATGEVDSWTISHVVKTPQQQQQQDLEIFTTIHYQHPDDSWSLVHASDVTTKPESPTHEAAVKIPATTFRRNKTGRIKVSISDGFNTSSITTENPINAPGFLPTIKIISPSRDKQKYTAGDHVYLHAATRDDRLERIEDKAVTWFYGDEEVAKGELTGFVKKVQHGGVESTKELRVEAVDYSGRKVVDKVEIIVEPLPALKIQPLQRLDGEEGE